MKKEIYNGIIQGISIFITLGICFVSYAAWINITTKSDGQTINAVAWNELVNNINTIGAKVDTLSNIPTGAIMAFNLTSCPTGWIAADGTNSTPDLRGEFIRGLDNGRGVDTGRTLASPQRASLSTGKWNGTTAVNSITSSDMTNYNQFGDLVSTNDNYPSAIRISQNGNAGSETLYNLIGNGAVGSRPRNVAFLYCIKQ